MQSKRPRFNPLILALALAAVLMVWSVLGGTGSASTADPQYFAARRQQRQLIALAGRDARFVHPLAQPVVYTSPRRAVDISRLAGAQDKTSIQRSYSSIIRLIF